MNTRIGLPNITLMHSTFKLRLAITDDTPRSQNIETLQIRQNNIENLVFVNSTFLPSIKPNNILQTLSLVFQFIFNQLF